MRIGITGSTGLVGTELVRALRARGDDLLRLVRRPPRESDEVEWDPARGPARPEELEGLGAVVHLAGEGIAARRWSAAQKERIRRSRAQGTRSLAEALAGRERPPHCFVSASAVGFYGDTGSRIVDEDSGPGTGFLPEVCQAWEGAAAPLAARGTRIVHLRFGVILSGKGGALKRMLPPFRLGVGGPLGSGTQGMSWIALPDAVRAILFALDHPELAGPVNAVAPEPCTNRRFTQALGRALGRPAVLPMPAFAARLAFGEVADALLLASSNVVPRRLPAHGFTWTMPEIEDALRRLLGEGAE